MPESIKPPKVFISYAWEEDTKIWVRELATRLRSNGVETLLDQWDVAPGDSLPEFMEKSVSASDFVLVVCTPAYKRKSDSSDPSGVGYEKGVITGELFVKRNQRKFIPILRKDKWLESAPSWVLGKVYIDLSGNPYNEDNYHELLKTLYGHREPPPPLGGRPDFSGKDYKKKDNAPERFAKKSAEDNKKLGANIGSINFKTISRIVGVVAAIVVLFLAGKYINPPPATPTPSITPTITPIPSPTDTRESPPISPTPTLDIGSTTTSPKDNMVMAFVSAGEFTMGSDNGEHYEKPVHTVYLDAFWIDSTEVTNAMYKLCVESGGCNQPGKLTYYSDLIYANYPAVYVNYNQATNYCMWAGRRLPTEAEWEKSASWDEQSKNKLAYPWGNIFDGTKLNFCDKSCSRDWANKEFNDGFTGIAPVGNYKNGMSPYGIYDMAGNVWEWVYDRFSETYYMNSPYSNPMGFDSGNKFVLRGGSWFNDSLSAYTYRRGNNTVGYDPSVSDSSVGFRCAQSAP